VKIGDDDPYRRQASNALTELRIVPRSTIQALFHLCRGVAVPVEHLESGIAKGPASQELDGQGTTAGLFTVYSCKQHLRPRHAHVAVKYQDYWFYIDDRDQQSKMTFTFVQQLVRLDLAAKEKDSSGPALTLSVGR
jgi:hypothetical protein